MEDTEEYSSTNIEGETHMMDREESEKYSKNPHRELLLHEEKIRNHVCGQCGYAASQKPHLKRHIEAVHENIRNHVCGECSYASSQKSALKKHRESVHNMGDRKIHLWTLFLQRAFRSDHLRYV